MITKSKVLSGIGLCVLLIGTGFISNKAFEIYFTRKNQSIEPVSIKDIEKSLNAPTTGTFIQLNTKEGAEATADKFGREWEQKNYSNMYDMFIPDLQKKKNKADFITLMNYLEKESQIIVRLDKISLEDNNTAYAYYTVNSSLFDVKAPAIKLEYSEGIWLFNAFANYFSMDLSEKQYSDKMIKIFEKYNSLMEEHNYNLKKYNITRDGWLLLNDSVKCSAIQGDMLFLEVPIKYKDFHSKFKGMIENTIKFMNSTVEYDIAKMKGEEKPERYLEDGKKYLKSMESDMAEIKIIIDQQRGLK